MIRSFKHKGLASFYTTGKAKGIKTTHRGRLRMLLAALDTATCLADIDIPGYGLHQLKGNRKLAWSIKVSANWRLTFRFREGHVHDLDYEDYH